MQNGLFTSISHSCYVTIYDRHAGDGINRSRNECGIFDIDSKRIHGKYLQLNDIRHTASATANKSERRDKEQMTFDKLPSSSLARSGSVLSALVIATFLFAGALTTVQQTAATTVTEEEQEVLDTQDAATENLSESDRDVNGIEFTPRWGAVTTLQPDDVKVLFADCLEDEFAVSSMYMFETPDFIAYQSFPIAFPDDTMTWLTVVKNTDTNNAGVASIGVICADENEGNEDDINIDIRTKTTIQNTVNNFVQVINNQVINLNNIVNIHQEITQNAYQIAYVTGNNNTVNQVIQQSATQILNANTTNSAAIQQTIDQNAQQQGVISGGGTLNQDIDQDADQAANVTGGFGGAVDQDIDQDADQAANVTGGFGGAVDQDIDQDADQAANVTGGAGTTVDQGIDQDADQGADVTGGGGNIVDQAIGQRGEQAANVTGGAGTTVDQGIDQGAGQAANVTGGFGGAVDQGIDQGAGQAANVTGGAGTTVDQGIDQDADQAADVEGIFGGTF